MKALLLLLALTACVHAEGSAAELDTQLYLSAELGFVKQDEAGPILSLIDEIRRMLNSLRRRLKETR